MLKSRAKFLILFVLNLFVCKQVFLMSSDVDDDLKGEIHKELKKRVNFINDSQEVFGQDNLDLEKLAGYLSQHQEVIGQLADEFSELGGVAYKGLEDVLKSNERQIEERIYSIKSELRTLPKNDGYRKRLEDIKIKLEKQLLDIKLENSQRLNQITSEGVGMIKDIALHAAKEKIEKEDRRNKRLFNILSAKEKIKTWTSKETLIPLTGSLMAGFAGVISSYYATRLIFNYLESKLGKPRLVRESSRINLKENILRHFRMKKVITPYAVDDVILEPKTKNKLMDFAQEIRAINENKLSFRNALFFGLPGTGKTMFAKALASYCNMDYAIMSGADFAQFKAGEDITELHKLFDWAKNSKRGLLIFIDEADSFLADRRILNNQDRNLLNAFLSRTGSSDTKTIFIFATNFENELDSAVLSRIHKKIEFLLPSKFERLKMLNFYLEKNLASSKIKRQINGKEVDIFVEINKDINSEFLDIVAEKIKGFSGRDIEQLVLELKVAVYNLGKGVLTKDIFNKILIDKTKEHEKDMQILEMQKRRHKKMLAT